MNITGGKLKGRIVKAPETLTTRPTLSKVRMSIFNVLYSLIGEFEGKSFLDLFAGSGIMGLEAASRGFSSITAIEKNKNVFNIIKLNYANLNVEGRLLCTDALKFLANTKDYFDIIYIDPPYLSGIYNDVLQKLPPFGAAVVEHSKPVDFSAFKLLKSKNYGGKILSYISSMQSEVNYDSSKH